MESPYNLDIPGTDFYATLTVFADRFLELATDSLGDILDTHGDLQVSLSYPARSTGEYAIELLTLGLLRLEYCGCQCHWHPTGKATRLSVQRLAKLVG